MRALGALQTAIGIAALSVSPRVAALIGLRASRLTGEAVFAWRLFAIRQTLFGIGVWANVRPVRQANWLLQPADLALFAHALRAGYITRRTAATCATLALGALSALALEHRAGRGSAVDEGAA